MKLKFITPLLFSVIFFGVQSLPAAAQSAQGAPTITLRLGDSGPQVVLLQKELNSSPDTLVATAGAGSPGQESSYFGAKTLDAVKRYQSKYSASILIPAGLLAPNGFVGTLTLQSLQKTLSMGSSYSASSTTTTTLLPSTTPSKVATQNSAFNDYLNAVNKLGIEQGYSSTTLALIADALQAATATTTDTVAQFYKEQQAQYKKQVSVEASKPFAERVFDKVVASAASLFMPQRAQAAAGLPFGGFVTYALPCTCTPGVTSIYVALPAPTATSNFVLDYIAGTEAFSWYTLPTPTVATLGAYTPGVQSCYIVVPHTCIILPAVGTITPEVGSSLVP